jgi:hypothetical protein
MLDAEIKHQSLDTLHLSPIDKYACPVIADVAQIINSLSLFSFANSSALSRAQQRVPDLYRR